MSRIHYLEARLENLAQRMASPAESQRETNQAAQATQIVSPASPSREVEVVPTPAPVIPQVPSAVTDAATAAVTTQ